MNSKSQPKNDAPPPTPPLQGSKIELEQLARTIGCSTDKLGTFQLIQENELPAIAHGLLAHDAHMTVTLEAFHECPVTVEVIQSRQTGDLYTREILLRRTSDNSTVLYGIVRLHLQCLDDAPRKEILSESIPLGRVLIEHDVLRHIELIDLWEIEAGPHLTDILRLPQQSRLYGRTALIYFDGQPALELLEVITQF